MPKVYIPHRGSNDYSDAARFGDVVFLTEGVWSSQDIPGIYAKLLPGLEHSSEDDFLVLAGLPTIFGLASSILAHKHRRVNYLIFHYGVYVPRHLDFERKESSMAGGMKPKPKPKPGK